MARPNSADPEATRQRVLDAAYAIAVVDGLGSVSARTVAAAAGVSASTVSATANGMAGVREELVDRAFRPIILAFSAAAEEGAPTSLFDVVLRPLRDDHVLPGFIVQVVGWTGLHQGEQEDAAAKVEKNWKAVRDVLQTFYIPKLVPSGVSDAALLADRLVTFYFSAALLLARDRTISDERLMLITGAS